MNSNQPFVARVRLCHDLTAELLLSSLLIQSFTALCSEVYGIRLATLLVKAIGFYCQTN